MRLPLFDRVDFLFTKALLILVAVAVPVFALGVPLGRWLSGRSLTWELEGVGATTVPDRLVPGAGVSLTGSETVAVRIEEAGAGPWLVSLVPGLLISLAVVLGVWLTLRLVRSIEQRRPFVQASAHALRWVGALLLLAPVLVGLGTGIADAVIAERALQDDVFSLTLSIAFLPVLAGLLVLAVGEAFAQGVRLQEDVEGLV